MAATIAGDVAGNLIAQVRTADARAGPGIRGSEGGPRRQGYCIVDLAVGAMRVTTIADRSRYSGTRGAILVFQKSLS